MSDEGFLSRWSRRKSQQSREEPAPLAKDPVPARAQVQPPVAQAATEPTPLPPVEALTPESDFTPFMQPGIDGGVKRAALKKLFADPRFNVMDGLDVYIDDYSKPDPLPEGWLEKMNQVRHLGVFKEDPVEAEAAGEPAEAPVADTSRPEALDAPQPDAGERLPEQEADKDPTSRN